MTQYASVSEMLRDMEPLDYLDGFADEFDRHLADTAEEREAEIAAILAEGCPK